MTAQLPAYPLAGLKVVELSKGIAASYCARQFAAWGADVVILEEQAGSVLRTMEPIVTGRSGSRHSLLWSYVAANKRSLCLDEINSESFNDLLSRADIFVTDYVDSDLAPFGVTLSSLHSAHPYLCIGSVTPFGLSGPYVDYAGCDLITQALSGYLAMNGLPDLPPLKTPRHVLEYAVGMSAFTGLLAAYLKRERTGHGDFMEVSEMETIGLLVTYLRVQYIGADKLREGGPEPGARIIRCKDGFISINMIADKARRDICKDLLDIPPDAWPDPLPEDYHGRINAIRDFMLPYAAKKTADVLFHGFEKHGVSCGKLIAPSELFKNEHLQARDYFRKLDHPDLGPLRYPGAAGKTIGIQLAPLQPAPDVIGAISPAELGWQRVHKDVSGSKDELPLDGLRVVDLTQAWLGPLATCLWADLGAEVIKVESQKRPDVWRQQSPMPVAINQISRAVNFSPNFNSVNRNKRSLALDLTTEEGKDIFRSLVRDADVVAENFTPKVMSRFGFSFEALSKLNPRLVMMSSSGFGKSGPWSLYKANGASIEALAGIDALHAYPGKDPILMGFYPADALCAFHMAALTLVCLVHRLKSGEGAAIDGSMFEAASTYVGECVLHASLGGQETAIGNRDTDMAPHGVFPCRGVDRWIAIAVGDDGAWRSLRSLPSFPESLQAPEYLTLAGRRAAEDEIECLLEQWTANQDAEELMQLLQEAGVAAGVVRGVTEGISDPHLVARQWFQIMTHPDVGTHKYNGFVWRFSACTLIAHTPPPRLGEHSAEVLKERLALEDHEIELLREKGVTGTVT